MDISKNKEEYIEAWDNHINDFNILAFCNNEGLRDKVKMCQEMLRTLVRQIAETKDLK